MLIEVWIKDNLCLFFGDCLVVEWFNKVVLKVKFGEVVFEKIDGEIVLIMMVNDLLLICCFLI